MNRFVKDLLFWETGLKAIPFDWMLLRYAYYNSEEDVYREVAGVYVNEGDAVRKGHEVELSLLIEDLTVFTSFQYMSSNPRACYLSLWFDGRF